MKKPVVWNRLESLANYNASNIGTNGTSTSGTPSFEAVKYGNGIKHGSSSTANSVGFFRSFPTDFTISYWMKAVNASTTAGSIHPGFGNYVFWVYVLSANVWRCYVYMNGVKLRYDFPITYSAGDVFHIAFVVSSGGSAGAKMKLYKDGVAITPNATLDSATWTATNCDVWLANDSASATFAFDNFKMYDYLLTDAQIKVDMRQRGGIDKQTGML